MPFFAKRFVAGIVLLCISFACFYLAPKESKDKPWYKPRWMRAGGLYAITGITLIGGSILLTTAIMEWLGYW